MKILQKEMKLNLYSSVTLAKEIGVSRATISNWLTGKTTPGLPQIKALQELGFSDAACLEPTKNVES